MASVNRVTLLGNLCADPDIRRLNNGDAVANLRLATSSTWKDKNSGERREKSEFHNVVVFNENIAKVCENYLKKGSKVYVEGSLQTRSWEKDGVKRYSTEVVLQKFRGELVMLDGKSGGGGYAEPSTDAPAFNDTPADLDDAIPFASSRSVW